MKLFTNSVTQLSIHSLTNQVPVYSRDHFVNKILIFAQMPHGSAFPGIICSDEEVYFTERAERR